MHINNASPAGCSLLGPVFLCRAAFSSSALWPWKSTESLYETGSLYIPERPSLMLQGSAVLCAAELSSSLPLWGLKETALWAFTDVSEEQERATSNMKDGLLVGRHSQLWNFCTKSLTALATGIFVWFCQLFVWVTLLPSAHTKPRLDFF